MVVVHHHDLLAPIAHGDRDDLVPEPAGAERGLGGLLAAQGVTVRLLPADAALDRQVLGGLRHGAAAMGIHQPHQKGVLELCVTHAQPGAQAPHDVRGLRHVFHAPGEDDFRLLQAEERGRGDDRLDTGAAQAIDGQRGDGVGQPGLQTDVTRPVHGVAARLHGVPEDHMIDVAGVGPRPLQRFAGGNRTELHFGQVLEEGVVFGHRRSSTGHDHGLEHGGPAAHRLSFGRPTPGPRS